MNRKIENECWVNIMFSFNCKKKEKYTHNWSHKWLTCGYRFHKNERDGKKGIKTILPQKFSSVFFHSLRRWCGACAAAFLVIWPFHALSRTHFIIFFFCNKKKMFFFSGLMNNDSGLREQFFLFLCALFCSKPIIDLP